MYLCILPLHFIQIALRKEETEIGENLTEENTLHYSLCNHPIENFFLLPEKELLVWSFSVKKQKNVNF